MKYSPAPWKLDEGDDEGNVLVVMDEAHKVYIGDLEDTCSTCHANAHLISAAPELLEALEDVMMWIDNWEPEMTGDGEWSASEEKARSAIAKAKGIQSNG